MGLAGWVAGCAGVVGGYVTEFGSRRERSGGRSTVAWSNVAVAERYGTAQSRLGSVRK